MVKLLVFSDSHRRNVDMLAAIEEEQPDVVLHLGDMVRDAENIEAAFPQQKLFYVRGNNDWNSDAEEDLMIRVGSKRILLTHGHLYGVRMGTRRLEEYARKNRCDIALYGHTHRAEQHRDGDVLIANPGSISMPYYGKPSYLRLTIKGNDVLSEIIYLH